MAAVEGQGQTASEYISHHLTHFGNKEMAAGSPVDFSVFHWDSMFFTLLVGALGCYFMWRAARNATSGVPGRFQAAVEILVEMVETKPRVSFTTRKAASWWRRWR
jgi:F-type H+-transporting ATPase subunit a